MSRVRAVTLRDDPVVRPPGFDLGEAWAAVVDSIDGLRGQERVTARTDPAYLGWLRAQFGTRLRVGEPDPDGWLPVDIGFEAGARPALALAGFAHGLEVIAPAGVRDDLATLGRALLDRYDS